MEFSLDATDEGSPRQTQSSGPWSCQSKFFVIISIVAVVGLVLTAPRKLLVLYAIVVAMIPMFISVFVLRRMGDSALSYSDMVEQIFFSAVPAYVCALIVELILLVLSLSAFFSSEIRQLYQDTAPGANQQEIYHKTQALLQSLPVWKLVAFSMFTAFILAALTEETAKLVVGLRFRRYLPMSAYNALALVVAGALGLATSEHLAVVLNQLLSTPGSEHALLSSTGFVFFRALLAFPVHLGCAFLVGVALSKKTCLRQQVRVFPAFLMAVLVHGTFDVVGLLALTLDSVNKAPHWVSNYGVVGMDVLITVALMLLCRREYNSLTMNGYENVDSLDEV